MFEQRISEQKSPKPSASRTPHPTSINKITLLGTLPPLRGLSSYCYELTKALAEQVNLQFISFKSIYPAKLYPGGNLKDDQTFPPLTHPNLTVRRSLTWYNPLSWLDEIRHCKGDILHLQWWSMPTALVYLTICLGFKARRKPIVFTVHNVLPHEKSTLFPLLARILFCWGNHFIVHTNQNKTQLTTHYKIPANKITTIAHGTLDFHIPARIDRPQIRHEFGFQPDEKVILLFGAIRAYKGVQTAIEAFAKTVRRVPQARLLIAGKLWQDWTIYAQLIDRLKLTPYIKTDLDYIPAGEVYKYFTAADLVVLPYRRFDSQSGVGATALAFRKPMIVTNVGGLPELVKSSHAIVKPGDPQNLAETLSRVLTDTATLKQMAADADKVAENFQWPGIAQKTLAVYAQIGQQ